MLGRFFFGLMILAVAVLLITVGFQVFAMLRSDGGDSMIAGPSEDSPLLREPAPTAVEAAEAAPQPAAHHTAAAKATDQTPAERRINARSLAAAKEIQKPAVAQELPIGRVEMVIGSGTALSEGGSSRDLDVGLPVFLNDVIGCGAGAKVKLSLDDGTVIWVGESSQMAIDSYVYQPKDADATECVLRFVKGACRVLTGAITSLNPEGFRMKLRMATVGIRGCETGCTSDETGDSIYVLALGDNESVVIDATEDGTPIMDPYSGKRLAVRGDQKKQVEVNEAGYSVTVTMGKGVGMQKLTADDVMRLKRKTSSLPPAQPDVLQRSDGAVVVIQPQMNRTARGDSTSQ